jgi:hypothetical protein
MNAQPWEISHTVRTDAGMCALWQPEHFAHVTGLDSWEDDVAEDAALVEHMKQGTFVPINVGGDGTFQITVRASAAGTGLRDRESRHVLVSSEPYLVISHGTLCLSGLEAVGALAGEQAFTLPVDAGRYSATVHLIDWKADPDSTTAQGQPTDDALPDFVVLISEAATSEAGFRTQVQTFDR